jgi:hypothetical protein
MPRAGNDLQEVQRLCKQAIFVLPVVRVKAISLLATRRERYSAGLTLMMREEKQEKNLRYSS